MGGIGSGRTEAKAYSIRKAKVNDRVYHSLAVPNSVADLIPKDTRFSAELTEEGILFRPTTETSDVPDWVKASQ